MAFSGEDIETIKVEARHEESTTDDEQGKACPEEYWPYWKLAIIALPQFGVQILWMFLGPNTTPYLMSLGASASFATFNNMAGPIVGFFVGPLVGTWSDQSTSKWGRRRPIIMAGLISTVIAGLLYSGAKQVMGEGDGAMYLAACMQWVLDFTINAMQTPFRALVSDLASEEQQMPIAIFFAVVCAGGGFLAFSIMELYEVAIHHMLELMSIILALNIVVVGVQMVVAREKQFVPRDGKKMSACGAITGMGSAFKGMPKVFYLLLLVQCLVWLGNTVWGVYGKVWFTDIVYQGNPDAAEGTALHTAYTDGSLGFSQAGQAGSILQLFVALGLMALASTAIPHNLLYSPCIFVGAAVCFCCAFLVGHSHNFAFWCFVLSNVALTASGSIPYGLVAVWNKQAEEAGHVGSIAMQMAIINCCITVGQQLCTMILGGFETSMDLETSLHGLFIISTVATALAGIGAIFLRGGSVKASTESGSCSETNTSE